MHFIMSEVVILRDRQIDIGIDISKVYNEVCNSASSIGYIHGFPFPTFEELFDEYIAMYVDEKTRMTNAKICDELLELKRKINKKEDYWTVENGFRPEHYGISKEAEFLNALLAVNYVFILNGDLLNAPIMEVW